MSYCRAPFSRATNFINGAKREFMEIFSRMTLVLVHDYCKECLSVVLSGTKSVRFF